MGWIPFESIGVASLTLGFQGRVYVFGNISGKRTYITVYNPTQSAFDSVSFQDFIMSVKRKVAELKRGYFSLNPFLNYQIIENSDYIVPSAGWESSRTRSYIVVGGDIIIKGSVFENPDHPVALIALRNAYGSGGNIYIE